MHINALFTLIVALTVGSNAHAQWPTDPTAPLILGDMLGFGPDHQVVTTTDGATWVAWIDDQCFASLWVQRISSDGALLSPSGLVLETRDNCDSLSPRIVPLDDNSIVIAAVDRPATEQPVYRVNATGAQIWGPDIIDDPQLASSVEMLLALPGGDTLIAGKDASSIILGRYAANGSGVWNPPTLRLDSATGSNKRIFDLQPDDDNGAYVLWDAPGTYTRTILVARIDGLGNSVWSDPKVVVAIPPGSSRHTDPLALADGFGGLLLLWTQGAEQGTTPVPIRMQRIDADGDTLLAAEGQRISMAATRQFDLRVARRTAGEDIFIAWRDGPINDQSIRAQRMSLTGERLWGDSGILVAPVTDSTSQFTIASLDDDTLGIAIGNTPTDLQPASVMLHRVSNAGQLASATVAISGSLDADGIQSASLDNAITVIWQRDAAGSRNELVAQRVRPDGTLGLADIDGDGIDDALDNCLNDANADQRDSNDDGFGNLCDADLNNDCIVNVIDLGLMRVEFFGTGPDADINGDGVVNVVDLGRLRQAFFTAPGPSGLNSNCP